MGLFSLSGNIVDIVHREIFPGTLTVEDGKIKNVCREKNRKYATYIMPGFIDAHVHIESSLLVPAEFARLAVIYGTVATVSDPHEIANVLGMPGIDFMMENGKRTPFKFYFGAPSCIPATPFETAGAIIAADDIRTLLERAEIKYLGEMMNFHGVISKSPDVWPKLQLAGNAYKPFDGHAPGLGGVDLVKYIGAGISTDHECISLVEAMEKINAGMKILIREGSAAKNLDALYPLIETHSGECMFCSDDKHPHDLAVGHINHMVRVAVAQGCGLMDVLRAAVLNPVAHYNLDVGLLRIGDDADFIIVDNLMEFNVLQTYIKGQMVAENGRTLLLNQPLEPINNFAAQKKNTADFRVAPFLGKMWVIEAIDGQLTTNALTAAPKIDGNCIIPDVDHDVLKIAVVNRYTDSKPAVGFIKNFGLQKGALASSVAHDSHNIIAVGASDDALCGAINAVIAAKGGLAVCDGEEIEMLPLPVAGLMSSHDGLAVAEKYSRLDQKAKHLGSRLKAPFMTLSFMSLLVIPKIKLSDQGLFDGEQFAFIGLKADE